MRVVCNEVTRYHEAGHAVVAYALQMTLERVSVVECQGGLVEGCAYIYAPSTTEPERAVATMGGAAATELFLGFQDPGAALDVRSFMEIKCRAQYNREWPDALDLQAVIERARRILQEHAGAVHALATALSQRSVLAGKEIAGIIEQSMRFGDASSSRAATDGNEMATNIVECAQQVDAT